MRTFSPSIDALLALAEAEGNGIAEISTAWEKTRQVVHMTGPMSRAVRQAGEGDPKLRFWTDDGSPHYWANTGFIDDVELVAIEFPRAR
jgi:hypothetical protein